VFNSETTALVTIPSKAIAKISLNFNRMIIPQKAQFSNKKTTKKMKIICKKY